MTHLAPGELVDAADGRLSAAGRAHAETCPTCQAEVARLCASLREVGAADVPEPSPLFWTHWTARLDAALDAEPPVAARWWSGVRWQLGLAVGVAASVALAVGLRSPVQTPVPRSANAAVSAPAPDGDGVPDSAAWGVLSELVADAEWDTDAASVELLAPGVADTAVSELNGDEQRELARLLTEELHRASS